MCTSLRIESYSKTAIVAIILESKIEQKNRTMHGSIMYYKKIAKLAMASELLTKTKKELIEIVKPLKRYNNWGSYSRYCDMSEFLD